MTKKYVKAAAPEATTTPKAQTSDNSNENDNNSSNSSGGVSASEVEEDGEIYFVDSTTQHRKKVEMVGMQKMGAKFSSQLSSLPHIALIGYNIATIDNGASSLTPGTVLHLGFFFYSLLLPFSFFVSLSFTVVPLPFFPAFGHALSFVIHITGPSVVPLSNTNNQTNRRSRS